MTDERSSSLDVTVPDPAVRGMVETVTDGWRVQSVDRCPHGTDFVATLDVLTPDEARTVVLKATTADLVPPAVARSEPRLLALVGRQTAIPVPEVFGYRDAHPEYPAPFYLTSHADGENVEGRPRELPDAARERVVRDAGRHLADLHALGPLPAAGRIGVADGELAVLDTDDHPSYDDYRDAFIAGCEDALVALADGGYFPDLAEDPERFADLVPAVREHLRGVVADLPSPDPPTYCHHDYRYGNLLVAPETGETRAVLDWANLTSADPAYNLASVESLLFDPDEDGQRRADELRRTFREAYDDAREGWSFDDAVRERMRVYRLGCRLDAMACLPLWYDDATPAERDERAREHRAFVEQYV